MRKGEGEVSRITTLYRLLQHFTYCSNKGVLGRNHRAHELFDDVTILTRPTERLRDGRTVILMVSVICTTPLFTSSYVMVVENDSGVLGLICVGEMAQLNVPLNNDVMTCDGNVAPDQTYVHRWLIMAQRRK